MKMHQKTKIQVNIKNCNVQTNQEKEVSYVKGVMKPSHQEKEKGRCRNES